MSGLSGSMGKLLSVAAVRVAVPAHAAARGQDTAGAAVAVTPVRMSVLYGDLDLSTPRDAHRLMLRVRNVAPDACKALDRLYALDPDESCNDKAVSNAAPLE